MPSPPRPSVPIEPPPLSPGASRAYGRTFALVLIAAAILAPQIVGRELLPPDEPRFALVAAETYWRADPVLLTRGGEPYLDKPPLLIWGAALGYALFGELNETGAHLSSLVASLVLAALLHRTCRRWFGEPAASAAVLVHLTTLLVLTRGASVSTDPLLSLGVFACIAALTNAGASPSRAGLAAAAWLSLALLAKGPVALAHLLAALLAARLAGFGTLSARPLLRVRPLALLVLLLAPWPALLALRVDDPAALAESFWLHTAVRYVRPFDNVESWWFYGASLAGGLFPWSLVLPAALARGRWRDLLRDERWRFLALWSFLVVSFFSLSAGKRNLYLLPIYPAMAIAIAASLPRPCETRSRRLVGAAFAICSVALLAAGTLVLLDPSGYGLLPESLPAVPDLRRGIVATTLVLAAGLAWATFAAFSRTERLVHGPAAAALAFSLLSPSLIVPAVNRVQGAREFGERLNEKIPLGATLGACRGKSDLVAWYAGRPVRFVETPELVAEFLAQEGPAALVCRAELLPPRRTWPPGASTVMRGRIGRLPLSILAWGVPAGAAGPEPPPRPDS